MKPFWNRSLTLARLPSRRPGKRGVLGLGLLVGSLLVLWLAWPYVTLWRVERAALDGDMRVLADLIDMSSVRTEIKRKLNKDADSDIGELSLEAIERIKTPSSVACFCIRIRSPRMAPPENGELGSTAMTATFFPSALIRIIK